MGSFLNVVILRLPLEKSLVKPGSSCPRCRKRIRWFDNIPVVSYLLLRGKCRNCKKAISARYPLVEFLTALLFFASYQQWGWGVELWVRIWPFLASLVAITFIDLDHRIIPDELSLGGLVYGLATSWISTDLSFSSSLIAAVVGFSIFYFFAWAYEKIAHKDGLGGGDIKFLAMLGAFLGLSGVFYTILLSSISGSLLGIFWALATRKKNLMGLAIPYGPFLVLGALIYLFFKDVEWLQFMKPI